MTKDFLGLFGKETDVITLALGDVLFGIRRKRGIR
jgi:hypothetical protein